MGIRLSALTMSLLVVAGMLLMSGRCWAVFYPLGPSKDEWGLKYDVEVIAADGDKANVDFTLNAEGRLKPIYSATVVAFKPDGDGGRTYLVQAPIKLKTTKDGQRAGQVQIRKEFLDGAMIRILTLTVDGRPQKAGAASYYIPLEKFINKARSPASLEAPPSVAAPSTSEVSK